MKLSKYISIALILGFVGIVTLEQMPGVMTATGEPYVSLMFNLFEISLLDDITHGVSGLLGIIAVFLGYKWWVRWLMVIGGYYALDALFFILNGFATNQPLIDNLLLNGPHIIITIAVIIALRSAVDSVVLRERV